mmetsp:Transcript_5353/g.19997  ORF Transcript_5353/g.19997 Transcript_5353/m.19997 type:complete len:219 (-) Transcript_5353:2887-3543(-)
MTGESFRIRREWVSGFVMTRVWSLWWERTRLRNWSNNTTRRKCNRGNNTSWSMNANRSTVRSMNATLPSMPTRNIRLTHTRSSNNSARLNTPLYKTRRATIITPTQDQPTMQRIHHPIFTKRHENCSRDKNFHEIHLGDETRILHHQQSCHLITNREQALEHKNKVWRNPQDFLHKEATYKKFRPRSATTSHNPRHIHLEHQPTTRILINTTIFLRTT